MKLFSIIFLMFFSIFAFSDTPPPGTVKAKMYSGDGTTAITATGSAMNVNITGGSGLTTTVNQGAAGASAWLSAITTSVLPTNACQETGGHLASIDTKLTAPLSVTGTFFQSTQPVSAVSLPLPTGAATSSAQTAAQTTLNTIATNTTSASTPTVSGTVTANAGTNLNTSLLAIESGGHLASIDLKVPALGQALAADSVPIVLTSSQLSTLTPLSSITATQTTGTNLHTVVDSGTITANAGTGTFAVDASGHTVPVSGTFWQATQPISAASLPLPTGAATSANQSTIITALGSPFQFGGSIGNSSFGISGTLPSYAATPTFNLGTLNGAATASLQTTGNSSLSTIATNIPAQGQALAASSMPVVLTAAQITTLTPPTSLTVTQGTAANLNATVTGTVAIGAGSAVIGHVISDSGSTTAVTALPAIPTGSNVIGKVSIDQTTPGTTNLVAIAANQSVNVAQINGTTPLMGNGTSGSGAQRVTISSDNTAFNVLTTPVGGATDSQTTGTVSTVITLAAPSNAQGFILQNLQTSTANLRFAMGATATTTLGMQLAPGQDSGFLPTSASVTIVAESGTQNYNIQWVAK